MSSISSISSIGKACIAEASVGKDGSVVDEGGGCRDDAGGASEDSCISISITLLPVNLGSFNSSKVLSSGCSNLRGQLRGHKGLRVECWGNKGLGVEGGGNRSIGGEGWGNSIIDWSNRETGILHTESSPVSNIPDLLELAIGINILVSSGHSSIGVANLLLGRVEVSIAVVEVAKLILGMELTASRVGGGGICSY